MSERRISHLPFITWTTPSSGLMTTMEPSSLTQLTENKSLSPNTLETVNGYSGLFAQPRVALSTFPDSTERQIATERNFVSTASPSALPSFPHLGRPLVRPSVARPSPVCVRRSLRCHRRRRRRGRYDQRRFSRRRGREGGRPRAELPPPTLHCCSTIEGAVEGRKSSGGEISAQILRLFLVAEAEDNIIITGLSVADMTNHRSERESR